MPECTDIERKDGRHVREMEAAQERLKPPFGGHNRRAAVREQEPDVQTWNGQDNGEFNQVLGQRQDACRAKTLSTMASWTRRRSGTSPARPFHLALRPMATQVRDMTDRVRKWWRAKVLRRALAECYYGDDCWLCSRRRRELAELLK